MPYRLLRSCSVPATPDAMHRHGAPQFGVNPDYLSATHVDATPGNGTFRLSPDFPAIGAGANSRVRAPSNAGESHWQKDLPPDRMAAIMPASGAWFPKRERRRTGRLTSH